MDEWRLAVTASLPFVAILLKWLAVIIRRGIGDGQILGKRVATFPLARHFRFLGWDMTSSSIGMYVASLVIRGTRFKAVADGFGDFRDVFVVGTLLAFMLFYTCSAICRYVTMERTEELCFHRWRWAFVGWILGSCMLATSSGLAVKVTMNSNSSNHLLYTRRASLIFVKATSREDAR